MVGRLRKRGPRGFCAPISHHSESSGRRSHRPTLERGGRCCEGQEGLVETPSRRPLSSIFARKTPLLNGSKEIPIYPRPPSISARYEFCSIQAHMSWTMRLSSLPSTISILSVSLYRTSLPFISPPPQLLRESCSNAPSAAWTITLRRTRTRFQPLISNFSLSIVRVRRVTTMALLHFMGSFASWLKVVSA